ncbi:MAG: response regulator [Anaerolineae bacterium]
MVLDLMLPGADGWEVCRRVRAGSAAPDLPIIMLTARDDDVDKIVLTRASWSPASRPYCVAQNAPPVPTHRSTWTTSP